jgi:hypothetical protein
MYQKILRWGENGPMGGKRILAKNKTLRGRLGTLRREFWDPSLKSWNKMINFLMQRTVSGSKMSAFIPLTCWAAFVM